MTSTLPTEPPCWPMLEFSFPPSTRPRSLHPSPQPSLPVLPSFRTVTEPPRRLLLTQLLALVGFLLIVPPFRRSLFTCCGVIWKGCFNPVSFLGELGPGAVSFTSVSHTFSSQVVKPKRTSVLTARSVEDPGGDNLANVLPTNSFSPPPQEILTPP